MYLYSFNNIFQLLWTITPTVNQASAHRIILADNTGHILITGFVFMAFVLSFFVPHLFFFWCIYKAVLCDYGIFCMFTYIFACYNEILFYKVYA